MVSAKQLGLFALKTVSDTIASGLKSEAGCPPKLRRSAINLAQASHRLITRMERNLYGRAPNIPILPLDEDKAVQAAGAILGELFLYFSVAGVVAIYNYKAQRKVERKKAKEEEARNDDLKAIELVYSQERLKHCARRQVELEKKHEELVRTTERLEEMRRRTEMLERSTKEFEEMVRRVEMLEELAKFAGCGSP